MSGQLINYSAIASDCGISDQTVRDYFSILEDTLIGFMLPAYGKSTRKQALSSPKFYFFDCGVERALKNDLRGPLPNDRQIFGRYFESFVINQIKALSSYFELDFKLYHFRTGNGLESDLIIERPGQSPVALEIKSTELLTSTHLKAFGKTQQLLPECEHLCLSQDPNSKQFGKIRAEHWRKGIAEILGIE
jgi:predicted AAA+ superfamily ATPase